MRDVHGVDSFTSIKLDDTFDNWLWVPSAYDHPCSVGDNKRRFPEQYRDVWKDEAMLKEAQAHAEQLKATLPELVANAA